MIDAIMYIIGAALLVFLVWKEYRRKNKDRRVWRILAAMLAVASLTCIAFPISFTQKNKTGTSKAALLLTQGFNDDSVSAFLRTDKNARVFTLDASLLSSQKFNAGLLTDAAEVSIHQLHVFGYGLKKEELSFIPSSFTFHPSATEGFTAILWKSNINTGESLIVEGKYKNTSRLPHKIILIGFSTTLDSVIIPAEKEQPFTCSTVPKQVGRTLFTIAVIAGKDTLQKQPVPVQVVQGQLLRVLMLSSSPDFENSGVKNWLAAQGYPVLIRTAISKNKYNKEYLNMPETNADRISASLLDKFDIIIADASELASIGRDELGTIQQYVSQKKSGLIVRTGGVAAERLFFSGYFPLAYTDSGRQSIELSLHDTSHRLPTLWGNHVGFIRGHYNTRALVVDKHARIFSAITVYGTGKIVMTSIPNSFSWVLSGNATAFNTVWSTLLNAAAPNTTATESWQVSPALPVVDEPTTISVQTQTGGIPQAETDGTTLYMQQNPMLPYQWAACFRATKEGWQTSIGHNGQLWHWYAYGMNDWKSVTAYNRLLSTLRYSVSTASQAAKANSHQLTTKQVQAVSKLWFFLLFLLAMSYLWFENKYYNR